MMDTVKNQYRLERQIIFESDRLRVVWQDAGTNVIFITFNELGLNKTGDVFWGFELFAKAVVSSIGIVTTEPNWYPPEDMLAAVEAINIKTAGCRTITYGHSQGGYGALRFASALNATVGIAFCPQWSIAPEAVGTFDQRYLKFYKEAWRNGLPIQAEHLPDQSFIFYDPLDLTDGKHVKLVADLGNVELVRVPLSGHETVRVVSEGGISGELIEAFCMTDLPSANQLRTLLRRARRNSKTYKSNLLAALLKKARLRQRCLDKIEAAEPRDAGFVALCRAIEGGDLSRARSLLLTCSDAEVVEAGAVNVWSIFRAGRFVEGEQRLARLFPKLYPQDAFIRLHAVNSYIEIEMYREANRELIQIIGDLDVSNHLSHVSIFAKVLAKKLS